MGEHRKERRDEVYRHHVQASRRLLPVGLEGLRIRHYGRLAVQARHTEGAFGGVQETGHPPLLLSLDNGLAPPRRPGAFLSELQRRRQIESELRAIRRNVYEAPAQGADNELRASWRALVRRRVDKGLDRAAGQGALR